MTHAHLTDQERTMKRTPERRTHKHGVAVGADETRYYFNKDRMLHTDRRVSHLRERLTAAPADTPAQLDGPTEKDFADFQAMTSETCASCGAIGCTETIEREVVLYGFETPPKGVAVFVPVIECLSCGFKCTDYRAEPIREAAVKWAVAQETPPQDAPDEVAEIEKRLECHYALEAFPDGAMLDDIATLLRLLKQRRLVTRERLRSAVSENAIGVPYADLYADKKEAIDDRYAKHDCNFPYKSDVDAAVDALLSADLGFKVVSEEEIRQALAHAQMCIDGLYIGATKERGDRTDLQVRTDAILRLFDGSAK